MNKNFRLDAKAFGETLRDKRKRAGFYYAENFSEHVEKITGVKIGKNAIYKIERGEQLPTLPQFIAISLVLNNSLFDQSLIAKSISDTNYLK